MAQPLSKICFLEEFAECFTRSISVRMLLVLPCLALFPPARFSIRLNTSCSTAKLKRGALVKNAYNNANSVCGRHGETAAGVCLADEVLRQST